MSPVFPVQLKRALVGKSDGGQGGGHGLDGGQADPERQLAAVAPRQLHCLLICLGLAQFPRHLRTSQTSSTRTSVEDGLQEKKGDRYAIDPGWLSYHQIHIFKEDLLKLSLCCTLIFCQG